MFSCEKSIFKTFISDISKGETVITVNADTVLKFIHHKESLNTAFFENYCFVLF